MYVCATHVYLLPEQGKGEHFIGELELQMATRWVLGIKPGFSGKAASALIHGVIPLALFKPGFKSWRCSSCLGPLTLNFKWIHLQKDNFLLTFPTLGKGTMGSFNLLVHSSLKHFFLPNVCFTHVYNDFQTFSPLNTQWYLSLLGCVSLCSLAFLNVCSIWLFHLLM